MTRHDGYGTYDTEIHRPFSTHLTVEQGEGTKGRPKKNTIVEMTALPGFIHRLKGTKVGAHKKHLDIGLENDSACELADDIGEALSGQDRHIAQMLGDDLDDAWNLVD